MDFSLVCETCFVPEKVIKRKFKTLFAKNNFAETFIFA